MAIFRGDKFILCLCAHHRYQELAELAVRWMRVQGGQAAAAQAAAQPRTPLLDQMAQELYRVVLFAVFYLQVCLLGLVPYFGATCRLGYKARIAPLCKADMWLHHHTC